MRRVDEMKERSEHDDRRRSKDRKEKDRRMTVEMQGCG